MKCSLRLSGEDPLEEEDGEVGLLLCSLDLTPAVVVDVVAVDVTAAGSDLEEEAYSGIVRNIRSCRIGVRCICS